MRHPHVREHIEMDFVLMKALARWIEALPGFGWLTLSDSMAQFSVTIASQVALGAEGKHLYVFNRNFRSMPDVRFPKTVFFTGEPFAEPRATPPPTISLSLCPRLTQNVTSHLR